MSPPRFFLNSPLETGTCVPLPDAVAHYALRVLRLAHDSPVTLFNGLGGEYEARLEVQGRHAQAHIGIHDPREAELAGELCLIQGLAGGDKMDWIVEKAVELGATRLVPIFARRSILQLRAEHMNKRLNKRLAHWQRIAQSASEQCGRNRIMTIEVPGSLEGYLGAVPVRPGTLSLLCHPAAEQRLDEALARWPEGRNPTHDRPVLRLLIGPEGGWSAEEQALALAAGVQAVRFGPRVLRTETAGLALMAACTALLGWNGPA